VWTKPPMTDEVMLTIRIPRSLRDEFQAIVKAQDITASQVLRGAIRQYVKAGREAPIENYPVTRPHSFSVDIPQQPQPRAPESPSVGKPAFSGIRAMLGMDED
jgi:hypothetical protein